MTYSRLTRQEKATFPDRKLNMLTKLFLAVSAFIVFGFAIFIISLFLSNVGVRLPENSMITIILFGFLKVWGIAFAYILPFGLITVGVWSIVYKESALKFPVPKILYGNDAVVAGIFYLVLGAVILWGVNGVVLSIVCSSTICSMLPYFIKFF